MSARVLSISTFTWKQPVAAGDVQKVDEILSELATALAGVERMEFGRSLEMTPISRDYAISILFRDEDAFRAYLSDPRHHTLRELTEAMAQDVAIIQLAG
jgi:hypothetical protein